MNAVTPAEKAPHPLVVFKSQLDNREAEFQSALPAHIPVERFKRVVLTAVQNNPELMECDRRSVFNAAIRAAQDGLLPDGREGAMVVRLDRKSQTGKSANWQPMIAGVRKKARNSGEIATWDAHVVHKNDHFQFQLGDNPQVNHSYDLMVDRGEIVGAYSVAVLKDGSKSFEVMSISDIHKIRDRSDGWKAFKANKIKSTPWSTDEGEMCRKTVARRHAKVLPMSTDLDDLMRRDDDLYDMRGAGDAIQKSERPSLTSALDRLAAPRDAIAHDEDGVIDQPNSNENSSDDGGSDPTLEDDGPEAEAPAASAEASGSTDLNSAREAGRKAAIDGKAKRAPGAYREDGHEEELQAWFDGYDEATNEAEG